MPLTNQGSLWPFSRSWELQSNPESSRLEFLEKFSANNFALSDAEDNTSRLFNREGIADLPLLRTLLAICQKSREPSLLKVINSFVLLAYDYKPV